MGKSDNTKKTISVAALIALIFVPSAILTEIWWGDWRIGIANVLLVVVALLFLAVVVMLFIMLVLIAQYLLDTWKH